MLTLKKQNDKICSTMFKSVIKLMQSAYFKHWQLFKIVAQKSF